MLGQKKIVLATRNQKKVEEIQRMNYSQTLAIIGLEAYCGMPEVEEDGATFAANAIKKAKAVAQYTQEWALADDSGLECDALAGAPGVHSARYAGEMASDRDNIAKLLLSLKNIPSAKRCGRFVCVLAESSPEGDVTLFKGHIEGKIAFEARGDNGFGYDPVFIPEGEDRTFAQMSKEEKDKRSHRGQALAAFFKKYGG